MATFHMLVMIVKCSLVAKDLLGSNVLSPTEQDGDIFLQSSSDVNFYETFQVSIINMRVAKVSNPASGVVGHQ